MRANIKTNIKRGIAVGLIVIMAAINPMQTLQPTGEGAPVVAKAAETDKAPYVGEVRLAVDSDPENAKRILISGGYEVIDQDLNEKAGSSWNELGDQAVYMGIKRTDDESKAIRDMKTMNMLGKYSFSDLKKAISRKTSESEQMYLGLSAAISEYRDNYEKGDYLAVKAHDILNYIIDDDSGKKSEIFFLMVHLGRSLSRYYWRETSISFAVLSKPLLLQVNKRMIKVTSGLNVCRQCPHIMIS